MKTLLLDGIAWDLVLDVAGNIALADDPYATAQDAASAIKLYRGELWYDTTQGVPYRKSILGASPPPLALMKAAFTAAAMTVPGVKQSACFISSVTARGVSGQVQVTDEAGRLSAAGF